MIKVNKSTSIFTLALFLVLWIVPLFSAADCNMDCCAVEQQSCHMEQVEERCCEAMSECDVDTFILIPTAPINNVKISKDLVIDFIAIYSEYKPLQNNFSYLWSIDKNCSMQAHSGFQIPLLV